MQRKVYSVPQVELHEMDAGLRILQGSIEFKMTNKAYDQQLSKERKSFFSKSYFDDEEECGDAEYDDME